MQRRYLETISESGRTLLAMLNDVLDLSKVEAGQLAVVAAPTDIRALLSCTIAPWRHAAENKGLALSLQTDAALPKTLEIDHVRVRQCVENLIANAIKFIDAGSLRIHAYGRGAGGDHVLKIDVEDTGVGIPAEELPGIFQPFHQLEQPNKRRSEGTGLGLAIVSNLAQLMGGGLTGVSAVGEGSTFTLTVKAPVVADASVSTEPTQSLLLVGADEGNRKTARAMLEQTGLAVAEAEDLADALVQGARAQFDGVLIELDTPGIEDASLINRLRRNRDGAERGMIFVGDASRERAFNGSFDLTNCIFVPKPLQLADLAAAAETILQDSPVAANGDLRLATPPGREAGGLLSAAPPH
jgi:CheY-like chemotaxis protein